uniref:Uncharacterized protein n=1 Tax=Paramoeba aestuarina TaxID=180227 RepID=A0A7S4US52_9EUKA
MCGFLFPVIAILSLAHYGVVIVDISYKEMLHIARLLRRNAGSNQQPGCYEINCRGVKGDIKFGYCTEWDKSKGTGRVQDDETKNEYMVTANDIFFPDDPPSDNSVPQPRQMTLKPSFERFLNVGEPLEFEITRKNNIEKAMKITGCGGSPVFGSAFSPELFTQREEKS